MSLLPYPPGPCRLVRQEPVHQLPAQPRPTAFTPCHLAWQERQVSQLAAKDVVTSFTTSGPLPPRAAGAKGSPATRAASTNRVHAPCHLAWQEREVCQLAAKDVVTSFTTSGPLSPRAAGAQGSPASRAAPTNRVHAPCHLAWQEREVCQLAASSTTSGPLPPCAAGAKGSPASPSQRGRSVNPPSRLAYLFGCGFGSTAAGPNFAKSGVSVLTPSAGISIFAVQQIPLSTRIRRSSIAQFR